MDPQKNAKILRKRSVKFIPMGFDRLNYSVARCVLNTVISKPQPAYSSCLAFKRGAVSPNNLKAVSLTDDRSW